MSVSLYKLRSGEYYVLGIPSNVEVTEFSLDRN